MYYLQPSSRLFINETEKESDIDSSKQNSYYNNNIGSKIYQNNEIENLENFNYQQNQENQNEENHFEQKILQSDFKIESKQQLQDYEDEIPLDYYKDIVQNLANKQLLENIASMRRTQNKLSFKKQPIIDNNNKNFITSQKYEQRDKINRIQNELNNNFKQINQNYQRGGNNSFKKRSISAASNIQQEKLGDKFHTSRLYWNIRKKPQSQNEQILLTDLNDQIQNKYERFNKNSAASSQRQLNFKSPYRSHSNLQKSNLNSHKQAINNVNKYLGKLNKQILKQDTQTYEISYQNCDKNILKKNNIIQKTQYSTYVKQLPIKLPEMMTNLNQMVSKQRKAWENYQQYLDDLKCNKNYRSMNFYRENQNKGIGFKGGNDLELKNQEFKILKQKNQIQMILEQSKRLKSQIEINQVINNENQLSDNKISKVVDSIFDKYQQELDLLSPQKNYEEQNYSPLQNKMHSIGEESFTQSIKSLKEFQDYYNYK